MAEEKKEKDSTVRTPYNFIPFPNKKPLVRYERPEDLPRHDVLDPELKTGTIRVTLTAETPVFVSDGKGKKAEFFRDPQGRFVIPGSTLRGLVRENMTILGFGLTRSGENFGDRRMFYREVAAAKASTAGELKEYYQGALGIEPRKSDSGKSYSIPEKVMAGYLYRDGDRYYIRPTLENGCYRRVKQSDEGIEALRNQWEQENPKGKKDSEKSWYGRSISVTYRPVDRRGNKDARDITAGTAVVPGKELGTLLVTGKHASRDPNHFYVFPLPDPEAVPVPITEEDAISYAADWEDRKNSLKAYYDPNFWALPEEGEEKPVFYIQQDSHVFFGMSLFLRIGYKHSLEEGLHPNQRKLLEEDPCALDYPYAVLGFAGEEKSYRSRVSFEDCPLVGAAQRKERFPAILGEPKPSYYPGYVEKGKHYGEDDFRLRGSKQYWLKAPEKPPVEEKREKIASSLRPLDVGSQFTGVIHYRNLTEDELGLLLWSLRLDEGCFQSIGMGKPYGYGRMKLTIDKLEEMEYDKCYTFAGMCATAASAEKTAERVDRYIRAYEDYACPIVHAKKVQGEKWITLRSVDTIRQFLFMRSTIMENERVGYMDLTEYKNLRNALPTVEDFMKEEEQRRKEAELSKPKTKEELLAALLAKRGPKH